MESERKGMEKAMARGMKRGERFVMPGRWGCERG